MKWQVQWKRGGRNYYAPGAVFDSYEEASQYARLRAKSATTDYRLVEMNGRYKEMTLPQIDALIRVAKILGTAWNVSLQEFLKGHIKDLPEMACDELQSLVDVSIDYPLVKLKQVTLGSLLTKRKLLKYRTAAESFEGQVELQIDEDCEVTLVPGGALVQTWLFIPKESIGE